MADELKDILRNIISSIKRLEIFAISLAVAVTFLSLNAYFETYAKWAKAMFYFFKPQTTSIITGIIIGAGSIYIGQKLVNNKSANNNPDK